MNRQQLIVAVKEAGYIERLADYIRQAPFGEQWQLTAFTNPNALRQFIRAGYPIDLLAVHPSLLEEIGDAVPAIPTALLVARIGQFQGRAEVLQFQPLPQLLNALAAVHAAHTGTLAQADRNRGRAKVAAVYAAVGGIGKTTLAIQLAQQLGGREERVFYLNLEQWNATSIWFGDEGQDDFSRMLYTVQAHPNKSQAVLAELRRRHPVLKLDYMAPSGNAEERLTMKAEQAKQIIAAVADSGQYDVVVVDLDSRMDPIHQAAFEEADVIIWLLSKEPVVIRKTSMALRYGEQKWGDAFQQQRRKFRFVDSFVHGSGEMSFNETLQVRIEGGIPYVAEWSEGRQLLDASGYAAYRSAVESLMNRFALLERGGEDARRNGTAAQS
ncbi:AAA family ATPase [Paenibacillus mendelii]|uniref:AAA family ATPase n=1 Tax=Paenibacillus mendelii TaxID=206163 RepID=A0ABV6JKI2_9BACL|nr:AAA family ATPase [Paenibacillus mendelii]MCQ6559129.1 AAA family ATPase [Paenibacillus mendelii]